jgi:hypothetical protein
LGSEIEIVLLLMPEIVRSSVAVGMDVAERRAADVAGEIVFASEGLPAEIARGVVLESRLCVDVSIQAADASRPEDGHIDIGILLPSLSHDGFSSRRRNVNADDTVMWL